MVTVLIADDEPAIRALIRATLDSDRFEIIEAGDGPTALALARERRPDLMFVDWIMPGCSGLEVARALRADPATAGTKLVMLSGRAQGYDDEEARAAGVDEYITKPFSPLRLLDAVNEVLGPEALL
jgi:CheY-like chemotaxis protein